MKDSPNRLLSRLYGEDYMEAYRLDSLLSTFNDDKYHDAAKVDALSRGIPPHGERVLGKLERDGNLKRDNDFITITSEGKLFLGKGGYTRDFREIKRGNIGFWISIGSALLAIASFIISLVK